MNAPTNETGSPHKENYRWIQFVVDPQWGKLSHIRLINILGAITASIIMFVLLRIGEMSEGYFGIYLAAVGLTAIGYKAVSNGSSDSTTKPPPE
jgi:hypothetical protein